MKRVAGVVVAAVVPLACVGAAVAPQLSGRLAGEDRPMAVGLVDPVDPFRGAYVALDYPGLAAVDDAAAASRQRGELFAELEQRDGLWVAAAVSRTRPDAGPYLSCRDTGWSADCGIGSWFASQEEAAELEQALADGGVAVVRIDARGRASVVDLR